MHLYYSGIVLDICHFTTFTQRPVYSEDETTYLFTHFRIGCRCVWNPFATASLNGGIVQPPIGQAGDVAAVSILTLRDTLLQPRGRLTIDIGGRVILDSPPTLTVAGTPPNTGACDANNGPRPIDCRVTAFHGVKTAVVDFECETWLNEHQIAGGAHVLQSNQWETSEEILEDYRSRIQAQGVAVFRADILQTLISRNVANAAQTVDGFRSLVVPPPRNGYQRKGLRVGLSSDNTRLYWSFVDEQCEGGYQMQRNSGIVRAEGYTFSELDWTGGAFGAPGLRLPDLYYGVHIEVWGRTRTPRKAIANALVKILATIFPKGAKDRMQVRGGIHLSFPKRHGWVDSTFVVSGLVGGIANLFGAPALADIPNTVDEFSVDGIWTVGAPQQVIQPGSDGRCGDGFGANQNQALVLMVQKLLGVGQQPPVPPNSAIQ